MSRISNERIHLTLTKKGSAPFSMILHVLVVCFFLLISLNYCFVSMIEMASFLVFVSTKE